MPDNSRQPESRDVSPKALIVFGVGLILFLVASLTLLALFFDTAARWPSTVVEQQGSGPLLQRSPKSELAAFRQREQQALTTLGWVDRDAGIARIPVADALRIAAENGFPDWGQKAANADGDCRFLMAAVPRAPQAARCRSAIRQQLEGGVE
ncbi:MAG: hypothetical protein WD767_03975 [Alphaproteobacteria bacterium]